MYVMGVNEKTYKSDVDVISVSHSKLLLLGEQVADTHPRRMLLAPPTVWSLATSKGSFSDRNIGLAPLAKVIHDKVLSLSRIRAHP